MKREIKFRGRKLSTGEWVYGDLTRGYSEEIAYISVDPLAGEVYEVDAKTVGQFTGLKDKNGTEIYEGDIVRFEVENADQWIGGTRGYIEYYSGEACFLIVTRGKRQVTINHGYDAYGGSLEVIGNIHESPELLEAL